ncbi:hypothetical protein GCM10010406_18150 [Streptomyces thermolineatus]|uniref:Large ribosomal subunit protein bL12 C-terminal domain-containing protein n=1 Tax=Streptomyces thermolineatus TaxID=44033 RepID=A0ABN3LGU4_9ACTN
MDIVLLVPITLLAFVVGSYEHKVRRIERRAARTERKVDLLLEHLGVAGTEEAPDRVRALLQEGKKVQAVKAYREITGADLKEAKDAVDRMETVL